MKKLYYLLLLSLFTSFILMSNDQENKNKVLAQQLSTINTQFQKWKKELEGYKKWALENDGVLSAEEQVEIDRRQKDMDAILARVAQIVKAKGLLAFMGLPTKEETKATAETKEEAPMTTEIETKEETPITTEIESKEEALATTNNETVEVEYAMGMKGGPNPEVTVTVQEDNIPKDDFIDFCMQKLSPSNTGNATNAVKEPKAKVNLSVFNSKVANLNFKTPLGQELHAKMKAALATLSSEPSAEEIIDQFESIASNYADEKALETHFKNNKAFYNYDPESRKKKENTPVVVNQKELNISQLETDLNRFLSIVGELLYLPEVMAAHPDNTIFHQWCSKLVGQLNLYRKETVQWQNTNATNLAEYLQRHFAFAPILGSLFVKNLDGEKLPTVAVYDRLYLNLKEIEKMNTADLQLNKDNFKFLPEDTIIINDIKRCELPAENPTMETDPTAFAKRMTDLLQKDSAKVCMVFDHPNDEIYLFDNASFRGSITKVLTNYNDCDRAVVFAVLNYAFKDKSAADVLYCKEMKEAFQFAISNVSVVQAKLKFFDLYQSKKCGLPSSLNLDILADTLKHHTHKVSAADCFKKYNNWISDNNIRNLMEQLAKSNAWADSVKFNTTNILSEIEAFFKKTIGGEPILGTIFDKHWKQVLASLSAPKTSIGELKTKWPTIFDNHLSGAEMALKERFDVMVKNEKPITEILNIQNNFINDLPSIKDFEQVLRRNKDGIVLPPNPIVSEEDLKCTVTYKDDKEKLDFSWDFLFKTKVEVAINDEGQASYAIKITNINTQNAVGKGAKLDFGKAQKVGDFKITDAYHTQQKVTLQLIVSYDKSTGKTTIPAGWSSVSIGISGGYEKNGISGSLSGEATYEFEQEEIHETNQKPESYLVELSFTVYGAVNVDAAFKKPEFLDINFAGLDESLTSVPAIDAKEIKKFLITIDSKATFKTKF